MNVKKLSVILFGVAVACAWADADTLGKTPKYWYTFENGKLNSHGSATLGFGWNGTYTFESRRNGASKAWLVASSGTSASNFKHGGGSFTMFFSVDPYDAKNVALVTFGSNENKDYVGNLYVGITSEGRVCLGRWDTSSSGGVKQLGTGFLAATGKAVRGKLQPYAVVYGADTHTIALYANGVKCGEEPFAGLGYEKMQFGSFYGGNLFNIVSMDGATSGKRAWLEDFRFYAEKLSEADIAKLAAERVSEWSADERAGLTCVSPQPTYWFTFDGAFCNRGPNDWLSSTYGNVPSGFCNPAPTKYVECRADGTQAGYDPSNGGKVYGNGFLHGGGSFTFFLSTTAGSTDNGIIIALNGNSSTSHNLALVRKDASTFKIVNWGSGTHAELASVTASSTAYSTVHPVAVRYDASAGTIALCVDGTWSDAVTFDGFPSGYLPYQICTMHGGTGHGLNKTSSVSYEDFRYYQKALTDVEVAALMTAYPASPFPKYWYTFTETNAVQHADALVMSYSGAGKSFAMKGTGVFARKGTYAATGLVTDYSQDQTGISGAFTVAISARGEVRKSKMNSGPLFAMGYNGNNGAPSTNTLAICVNSGGKNVTLRKWYKNVSTSGDMIVFGPFDLANAHDFNHYAVT